MRILITGASGLLGLNLALEARKEHQIVGLVNQHALRTDAFQVLQGDLLQPGSMERILEQAQPEGIIHCAAIAIVDACESEPVKAQQINAEVPGRLAELAGEAGIRFLHISTDAVFDGQTSSYTEEDAPNPLSIYAQTKREGELRVLQSNPQAAVARVNLFGWSLSGRRSLSEFFFYNLQAGEPVSGFTDVFFCPLLANHLAPILLRMLETNCQGLYHAVSRECTSKYEFGRALARRFGLDETLVRPAQVETSGLKAARSPNLTLSSQRLAEVLGAPLPDLSTGLEGLYRLYQQGYPQALFEMKG